MFQPFERFKMQYLDKLSALNKKYLVSQSYAHGFDHFEEAKTDLLFSDYDDKGLAIIHYKAVRHDKFASIIDLNNIKHTKKVQEMLTDESKYRVYWAVVSNAADIKKRLDHKYKNHIRRFIELNTTWRVGSDEQIRPSLQLIFGELFIILKRGSQTLRVKFEEIEKA